MELHDRIVKELLKDHSLAALIYLIEKGRELEFSLGGATYFLSRHGAQKQFSLWSGDQEQSFDSLEELLENATLAGNSFLAAWPEVQIETLF